MIKVIIAPEELYSIQKRKSTKIFLAGGITNCEDWQSEFISLCRQKIKKENHLVFYNPRRKIFTDTKEESEIQIVWEFEHLEQSDRIIYWFAAGSLNPIVLYELGRYVGKKEILIGIDPLYERKLDVEIQSKLAGYKKKIVYSVTELVDLFIKDSGFFSSKSIGI